MAREMKESRVKWAGEIPKHWDEAKTLFMLEQPITDGPHETPIAVDEGIPFISAEAVSSGEIDFNHKWGNISKEYYEECSKKYIPRIDDIYMIKSGASTGQTAIVKTNELFTIWSPLAVFRANKKIMHPSFLLYVLRSEAYQKQVEAMWSYGTQQNIGMRTLEKLIISYPKSLSEQQSIANFLDEKCSEIDELISLQEKMIDELKLYKQSVITEAVIKGLDRNVKMKDSGIAMIGTIPYHWGIAHFTKVNWIRARLGWKGLKAEEYVEQGHPFLSAFNIINDKLDWRDLNFIDDIRYEESPEIKLTVNDLVLVKDGAGIGKCAVVDSLPYGTSTVNSSLAVITPNKHINSLYQYYCLKSEAFQKIIWQLKIGMGVPHLTQENMKAIINPCPPLEEQIKIASYLDTKCSEIDTLISIKQQKIEELKEYKKSLIYEYVTGKKEVV